MERGVRTSNFCAYERYKETILGYKQILLNSNKSEQQKFSSLTNDQLSQRILLTNMTSERDDFKSLKILNL